jgi:hypothetical protein
MITGILDFIRPPVIEVSSFLLNQQSRYISPPYLRTETDSLSETLRSVALFWKRQERFAFRLWDEFLVLFYLSTAQSNRHSNMTLCFLVVIFVWVAAKMYLTEKNYGFANCSSIHWLQMLMWTKPVTVSASWCVSSPSLSSIFTTRLKLSFHLPLGYLSSLFPWDFPFGAICRTYFGFLDLIWLIITMFQYGASTVPCFDLHGSFAYQECLFNSSWNILGPGFL